MWGSRLVRVCVLGLAALAARAPADQPTTHASRPAKIKITISRATTYVLGPVNPDGTINYVAALNAQVSKGVTPENNAAIPLIRALGPDHLSPLFAERGLKALGMPPLPKRGHYLVSLLAFETPLARESGTELDLEAMYERLRRAGRAPWSATDYPIIYDWLRANERPLSLVVAATRRPRYYVPLLGWGEPPSMIGGLVLPHSGLSEVTRALVARAMLEVGSGDIPSARRDLMATRRLARLVGQSPTYEGWLLASGFEARASQAEGALVASAKLSASQARAHLAEVQALPPLPGVAPWLNRMERLCCLDLAMSMIRKGPKAYAGISADEAQQGPEPSIDADLLLGTINAWYDRLVAAVGKPTFSQRKKALANFAQDLKKLKERLRDRYGLPLDFNMAQLLKGLKKALEVLARGQGVSREQSSRAWAELMVAMTIGTLPGEASVFFDRRAMQGRLAVVALGLAAYRAERGSYPAGLAALEPACLKAVPNDLFTEKPLRYSRVGKGFLLYSVGENMADDGGKDRAAGGDDIVVRVK